MPSVSYAQAAQLSFCAPIEPRFDQLVTDQVLRRLPVREVETQCAKRARITEADKPTIAYIATGGAFDANPVVFTPVAGERTTARIGQTIVISGDALNIAKEMVGLQAKLLTELVMQKVGQQLWTEIPDANTPFGMPVYATRNPNGVISRAADAITLTDLNDLRTLISPWAPTTPLAYVMNSRLFSELENTAMAAGTPISYRRDDRTGAVAPYWGSFPILLCDWISMHETAIGGLDTTSVYLLRLGTAADDPAGIAGMSIVVPQGGQNVRVSALEPDGSSSVDQWRATVYWDFGLEGGSWGAAIGRLRGILSP